MLKILINFILLVHTSNALITINYTSWDCYDSPTFTSNSSYQANLGLLLSALASNVSTSSNGFSSFTSSSISGSPDSAYGLTLCRGDIDPNECQDCVQMASKEILLKCPRATKAVIWKEECMLHYSDDSIFATLEDSPQQVLHNTYNATDLDRWIRVLGDLMGNVSSEAARERNGRKFATMMARFSPFQILNTLAQCTPDLSTADCGKCLSAATTSLPIHSQGGIVLTPSCTVRYEVYTFYRNTSFDISASPVLAPPPRLTASSTGKKKASAMKTIIPTIAVVAILATVLTIGICFFRRKRKYRSTNVRSDNHGDFVTAESLLFDLNTLQDATHNFSDEHKLGQGGFGPVYKGTLSNGEEIAVKRLSKSSNQGVEEFKNEVVLVAKLQHRNLVRLLGFCLQGGEQLLVYEFVPNKSLDHFLFDPLKQRQLNWSRRYNIIRGIARGMLYLHEDSRLRIIHRDLKASNILLDEDMTPKISDFGVARIFGIEQTSADTSRVVGTYGYMAPEYALHGQFSIKSDVFSFGVLVLEIVSGQKINASRQSGVGEDLLSQAWRCWRDGTPLEVMDATMKNSYSSDEVMKCIHIALSCVQEDMNERPTMATVVHMINSRASTQGLPLPQQPAFFYYSRTESTSFSRSGRYSGTTTTTSTRNSTLGPSTEKTTTTELDPR